MSSEVIPARQNSVKKSVTAPALCTLSRSYGASETVHDVILVQESSKLSSLPTSASMAPEFVPNISIIKKLHISQTQLGVPTSEEGPNFYRRH